MRHPVMPLQTFASSPSDAPDAERGLEAACVFLRAGQEVAPPLVGPGLGRQKLRQLLPVAIPQSDNDVRMSHGIKVSQSWRHSMMA